MHRTPAQWVESQPWPEEDRTAALAIVAWRTERNLNPMTRGQWKTWAIERGLTPVFGAA